MAAPRPRPIASRPLRPAPEGWIVQDERGTELGDPAIGAEILGRDYFDPVARCRHVGCAHAAVELCIRGDTGGVEHMSPRPVVDLLDGHDDAASVLLQCTR